MSDRSGLRRNFDLFFPAKFLGVLCDLYPDICSIFIQDHEFPVIPIAPKWLVRHASNSYVLHRARSDRLGVMIAETFTDLSDFLIQEWSLNEFSNQSMIRSHALGFTGGLAGFLGYDAMAATQAQITTSLGPLGGVWLGDFDVYIRLNPEKTHWALYGPDDPLLQPLYEVLIECAAMSSGSDWTASSSCQLTSPFQPYWKPEQYQQAFYKIQDYLKAGDCYQVNLTQPFGAQFEGSLLDLAEPLRRYTQAPYSGWLRLEPGVEMLSCSPELFLEFDAQGQVITRPIKGTRPRDSDPVRDALLARELANSSKDLAENLMIVDLLRNDLGHHATPGSVSVPHLFEVESFAQVHHLVSEVRAQLSDSSGSLQLLLDALPGGSITGAPKIRAMEIIHELEAKPRGAYCGSMGYLNHDGSGRWNILIRTLQLQHGQLDVWAGGGITISSDCEAEYQECLDKVGGLMREIERISGRRS